MAIYFKSTFNTWQSTLNLPSIHGNLLYPHYAGTLFHSPLELLITFYQTHPSPTTDNFNLSITLLSLNLHTSIYFSPFQSINNLYLASNWNKLTPHKYIYSAYIITTAFILSISSTINPIIHISQTTPLYLL